MRMIPLNAGELSRELRQPANQREPAPAYAGTGFCVAFCGNVGGYVKCV